MPLPGGFLDDEEEAVDDRRPDPKALAEAEAAEAKERERDKPRAAPKRKHDAVVKPTWGSSGWRLPKVQIVADDDDRPVRLPDAVSPAAPPVAAPPPEDADGPPPGPPAMRARFCGLAGAMHWPWRENVLEWVRVRKVYDDKLAALRLDPSQLDDMDHPGLGKEPYDPSRKTCFLCNHSAQQQQSDELKNVINIFKAECREMGFEAAATRFSTTYDDIYRNKWPLTHCAWPPERIMYHFIFESMDTAFATLYELHQIHMALAITVGKLGLKDLTTGETHVNVDQMVTFQKLLGMQKDLARVQTILLQIQ